MWESPITMITENIVRDITRKTDGVLVEYVHNVGFDVDKEELAKALAYDRNQYEKGYADGRADRDAEIVRCKDCIHKEREQPGMVFCPMMVGSWVDEDHFCGWGERREDGD